MYVSVVFELELNIESKQRHSYDGIETELELGLHGTYTREIFSDRNQIRVECYTVFSETLLLIQKGSRSSYSLLCNSFFKGS